ncbi:MAG: D-alanyl-D-alanine carboxypeptidase family protein [Patescibacteria group bacterium]|nr:D-alanyl-D-alanine carboxypeptidase family protein [Patescibacteria group bacterium]
MKSFVNFVYKSKKLKTNFLLVFIFLILLPSRNYYSSLDLSNGNPVVRSSPHQFISISDYPVNHTNIQAPYLSARSIIIIDQNSKTILYQKNPDLISSPASITKVMTALVVLDNYQLDQVVTINSLNSIGQIMELEIGEQITVENLLYGLLVQSGNDAAYTLANLHQDGQKGFIKAMNNKAKELKLHNTQFQNPTGLDSYGHYSTTHDIAILGAIAMENKIFKKMVNTKTITITDVNNTVIHKLETINDLLGKVSGLKGIKTGWTELAGECLVTYTKRGNKEIITVILGSQDRFGESAQLIDWTFNNHQWLKVSPTIH